jgi:fructuronate reductase
MERLGAETYKDVHPGVRRPRYDREGVGIGMAHIGLGAFHRCHQGEYTDDMLESRRANWGVVGVNLRPPSIGPMLGKQDGLYARRLRDDSGVDNVRIIGCIRRVVDAQTDVAPAIAALSDPRIKVVTLTITEKGYCHVPATGVIDENHPDISHDLNEPAAPRSAPGVLVAALEQRRRTGASGLTLLSCDNIPSNGAVLHGVVGHLARAHSPDLAQWIHDRVTFPSSMVDRIVPATGETDVAEISTILGRSDQACVVGEPFRQWVIEDRFAAGRPPWDVAGAQFVTDVSPYELIKMRVLNGAQTTLCYLGALGGLQYTFEDARHPVLESFVRRMLQEETAPNLPIAPGMGAQGYIDLSLRRLRNSTIRHRNHQIATDGSQKIVQRLLNPMRDRIRQGAPFERLACAVAGYIAYLAAASPRYGARWQPSDPFASAVRDIADDPAGDLNLLVRRTMELSAIFGSDLRQTPEAVATISRHIAGLLSENPIAYLESL